MTISTFRHWKMGRDCEKAINRIGSAASLLWDGWIFEIRTPDGTIDHEQNEQLVDEMYEFQEDLIGYLSFWPKISISRLERFQRQADEIRQKLPDGYLRTSAAVREFEDLIANSLPLLKRCID